MAVPTTRALTSLNISNNNLGEHRDAYGNRISDITGVQAFAAAIPECK